MNKREITVKEIIFETIHMKEREQKLLHVTESKLESWTTVKMLKWNDHRSTNIDHKSIERMLKWHSNRRTNHCQKELESRARQSTKLSIFKFKKHLSLCLSTIFTQLNEYSILPMPFWGYFHTILSQFISSSAANVIPLFRWQHTDEPKLPK